MNHYDCIVIGGGPSGLMASVSAATHGAKTLLIDKGDKLGRKLGISGGGRCNVTNAADLDTLIKHIPGNGRFLHSAFSQFNNRDIIHFFEGLGIQLKEEDRGRMFPVSDKAKTVVDALINKVRSLHVDIRVNAAVDRVIYDTDRVLGVQLHNGERLLSPTVVIATGGKSVPHTGSTGDGYAWAEAAGHTITPLYPTEVPITSSEVWVRERQLQGISLRDIVLSVWDPFGKLVKAHEGDMIFTHFGISGPVALRCSQYVLKTLRKHGVPQVLMSIDLFPTWQLPVLQDKLYELATHEPRKAVKTIWRSLVQERQLLFLLKHTEIDENTTGDALSRTTCLRFAQCCKRFEFIATGTLSLDEAFVTGGGVHLKEVDPRTMGSKLMEGLYFCGEILDIHGYTGGYNITAAFTTGYTAGKSAAESNRV
jgi:predicted Rossmann fold flavoprotein